MEVFIKQINDNINKKMSELKEEFAIQTNNLAANMVSTIEEKLKPLVDDNTKLKNEVEMLNVKVRNLEKEVRKNNVLIHGVEETENNNIELLQLVLSTLNDMRKDTEMENFDKWEISEVRRLGIKQDNKLRPILVKFTLTWRRTDILKNNKMFPKNMYATEDFPKDIVKIRKDLKIKQQEEIKKGNLAIIRYDKLIVKEKQNEVIFGRKDNLTGKERQHVEAKRKRSPTKSPPANEPQPKETVVAAPTKINKSYDTFRNRANSSKQ